MEISKGTAEKLAEKAANPANARATRVTEATRVPMNLPEPKLAVPELPGYYLYWHLGKNVPRALRAGYEFVDQDEVTVRNTGIANDMGVDGSTDMGTRISVSAGESGEKEAERLYLMKIPLEWHEKDVAALAARNEEIASALRSGDIGGEKDSVTDRSRRFLKEGQDLFYPKVRRR